MEARTVAHLPLGDDAGFAGADVHRHLAASVCGLHELTRSDSAGLLSKIPAAAAGVIPGTAHAAISAVEDGRVRTLASTDSYLEALDRLQERHAQGPYFELPWERRTCSTDDLRNERRWPKLTMALDGALPIRSVLWCQLHTDYGAGSVVVTVCAEAPAAFTADAEQLACLLGCHLGLLLDAADRELQARTAAGNRELMGIAKGILMQRFSLDSEAASALLARMSRQVNKSVTRVARDVVAGAAGAA